MKRLILMMLFSFGVAKAQNIVITPTTAPLGYASATSGSFTDKKFYYGNWKDSLSIYLIKSDTSVFARKIGLFTKTQADVLYRPIVYVPSWGEITGKPTFSTVATSGAYADLSGKPTIPTAVQQFGANYTKEWNGKATTTTSSNSYSFNISNAGFTSITSIQVSAYYNGGNSQTMPIPSVNSYSNTSVNIVIAESANTNVLVGGTVEGLTDFSRNGAEIFVTVKGN